MIVVKIELWPKGDEKRARPLGVIMIHNDGSGDAKTGNYKATLSHAGWFFGKRREPFKQCRVRGFLRTLSPYRLLSRILRAAGEL